MRKELKKQNIVIAIIALLLVVTIGYATLQANLTINGTSKINNSTWNVHFNNPTVSTGSVAIDTSTYADAHAARKDSATQVSYSVLLTNPGDFYEFTVPVQNEGTIDAMIDTITSTIKIGTGNVTTINSSSDLPAWLNYSVTYSDGITIAPKHELNSGTTETYKVRVEFKRDIDNTQLEDAAGKELKLTFSVNYVQKDDTAIEKPSKKCIRATTLHTETCTNSNTSLYCQGAGYALNATITYGNQTTTDGVLTTGDAFDCDVDGTGYNQRFYYVSDYYDTSTKNFNDKVAVLIYYSNVRGGVASTEGTAYATQADAQAVGTCTSSSGCNWYGPLTARAELPTTTQWSNISLYKDKRQILAKNDATSTSGGTLPTAFDYSEYAARLLTYQEAYSGCNSYESNSKYPTSTGGLDAKCQFLMEGTIFSNNSLSTIDFGPWFESPFASNSYNAYNVYSYNRSLNFNSASRANYGASPTIEILKSEISY